MTRFRPYRRVAGRMVRRVFPNLARDNPIPAFGFMAAAAAARLAMREARREARPAVRRILGKRDPNIDNRLEDLPQSVAQRPRKAGPMPKRARTSPGASNRRFRSGKSGGKFRKATKPKSLKDVVRRKYDDHATMDKDHAAWLGVQHHSSLSRLYDIFGEAVTKMILNKDKIYPKHYDQVVGGECSLILMGFKRMNPSTGQDEFSTDTGNNIAVGATDTFKGLATAIADRLQLRASGGTPSGGGYYLYSIETRRPGAAQGVIMKDMDTAKLMLQVTRSVRIQNITKSDDAPVGAAGSVTDINVNPLSGKKYKFSQAVPKLIDQLNVTLGGAGFENHSPNVSGVTSVIGDIAQDDILAHPVNAKSLFTNCRGSANISLAPGKYKKEVVKFSYNGTIKAFVLKNPITALGQLYNYTVTPSGSCTWFCFEQALRHGNHVKVGLGIDIDTSMSCKVYPRHEKAMLRHYEQETVIFPS